MIPVLIVCGLALLGWKLGTSHSQSQQTPARIVTSGREPNYYRSLECVEVQGLEPKRWLINAAIRQAYDRGDWKRVRDLSKRYGVTAKLVSTPFQKPSSPSPSPETGAIVIKSPLDNVSDDDWKDLLSALRTKSPDYRGDKHVGAYEHSKRRLSQLGLDNLSTEQSQSDAISTDLSRHFEASANLIGKWCGDIVECDGVQHSITMSGMLGLLKSAGPQGAESWLENDKRLKYTTDTFLRTNGIF